MQLIITFINKVLKKLTKWNYLLKELEQILLKTYFAQTAPPPPFLPNSQPLVDHRRRLPAPAPMVVYNVRRAQSLQRMKYTVTKLV